jgi:hypothetical protein
MTYLVFLRLILVPFKTNLVFSMLNFFYLHDSLWVSPWVLSFDPQTESSNLENHTIFNNDLIKENSWWPFLKLSDPTGGSGF